MNTDQFLVTIMGESAGAMGVGHLINTYSDNQPFRAGIQMSGSSVYSLPNLEGGAVDDDWIKLIELLNCTDPSAAGQLACARAVDAETLITILQSNNLKFTDVVKNNITALERPDIAWAAGNVARVPLMIGSTADDASYFAQAMLLAAASSPSSNTSAASDLTIPTLLETLVGLDPEAAESLAALYTTDSASSTPQALLSRIATDYIFRCTSGLVANLTSTLLDVPAWQYRFDAQVPSNTWEEYPDLGVYHASEIAMVFGTYPRVNSSEAEARLSRSMQTQFADFVKDPQRGPGWAQWPRVGVLGVNEMGAVTTTEDGGWLDKVCRGYDAFYLSKLPALERLSSSGLSDDFRSNGTALEVTGGASRTAVGAVGLGAGLLGLAVVL
jgi:carboxylesterase type B